MLSISTGERLIDLWSNLKCWWRRRKSPFDDFPIRDGNLHKTMNLKTLRSQIAFAHIRYLFVFTSPPHIDDKRARVLKAEYLFIINWNAVNILLLFSRAEFFFLGNMLACKWRHSEQKLMSTNVEKENYVEICIETGTKWKLNWLKLFKELKYSSRFVTNQLICLALTAENNTGTTFYRSHICKVSMNLKIPMWMFTKSGSSFTLSELHT